MKISNYEEAVNLLLPRLEEYLQSRGIDTSKNFRCLSPNHEDKNPSCGLVPNKEAWHCHSCSASGTIFNACAILEDKPITGPEFISDTLTYLADKYEVHIKKEQPTEEELYRIDTYRAYRIASELVINGTPTTSFTKAIEARKWSSEICKQLGIGFVSDFKEFKDSLRLAGFTQKFLAEIDLNRDTIFGPDRLIFTIRDEYGAPVGFASRNLGFEKSTNGESKYVNQRGTGVKCNIYQKSRRLFGLDSFLKSRDKKQTPLYIFEGYSDVATATEHGLRNCVGIGGTALTTEHIYLLKEKNIYDIILCLDGDEAGQNAVARLLDTVLAGHKDLNVRIVIIPNNMDPDEFIRQEGILKFRELKKYSAFEWRLGKFDDDTDSEIICQKMIRLIVNERSYIKQEKMANELARATGFTIKAIQRELDQIQNKRETEKARDISEVGERLTQEIKKNPQDIQHLIQQAETSLYDLSRKYEEDAFSEEALVSRIRAQKEFEENLDGSFSGFILGPSMSSFQEALAGNWKKDVWLVCGGKANVGKTSFVVKLAYEIASHEEENNPLVIYHTIDDTFEQVLPKFVALAADTSKLELNMISNPKYAISNTGDSNSIMENRDDGYNQIIDLAKRGRLIIKDCDDGISLSFADHMIRRYKEMYPDRNVVYILDNFHKLEDFQNAKGDQRVKFRTLSTVIKGIATKHHIAIITTVEYKKIEQGKRASNSDISETGQIEYDANLIFHVYNESHEHSAAATTVHRDKDGKKLPIVELDISKNKITTFKDRLYFQFWPASSRFHEVAPAVVEHYKKVEKDKLGQDDELHKEVFNKCANLAKEQGSTNPGRAWYLIFNELGLDSEKEEDKQTVSVIWNKFGGKVGVQRIWDS